MRKQILIICICLLMMLSGCKKQEKQQEVKTPTVQISYAAFQFDQESQSYTLAEGWKYDMTISSEKQRAEIDELLSRIQYELLDQQFEMDTGYHLLFRNEEGEKTEEMLLLRGGQVSKKGMIYEAQGTEGITEWLDALKLKEQSVGG